MSACPEPATVILPTRPLPPLCSQEIRTIRVSLTLILEIPSAHGNSIHHVEWDLAMKCAIGLASTNESNSGRNGYSCHVFFRAVMEVKSLGGRWQGHEVNHPPLFALWERQAANNMNFNFARLREMCVLGRRCFFLRWDASRTYRTKCGGFPYRLERSRYWIYLETIRPRSFSLYEERRSEWAVPGPSTGPLEKRDEFVTHDSIAGVACSSN